MSPVTHLLASWLVAAPIAESRRERFAITAAGVFPDLDGLGCMVDAFNRLCRGAGTEWFSAWHHMLLHGLLGVVAAMMGAYVFGCRRPSTLLLVAASVHIHLGMDVLGSRGLSEEELWPIFYFAPMTKTLPISWAGQWPLNAWQNVLFTATLLIGTVWMAVCRGVSPVSLLSEQADVLVVSALRKRFAILAGS